MNRESVVAEEKARRRAEMILKVQGGRATASDAAQALGVSRKTYYKWERRGLEGMVAALGEREGGRPATPVDTEKESLRREIEALRRKVQETEQREAIREILKDEPEPGQREGRTEKKGRGP